ncbi:hypothetical protein [Streptomyces sp. NPDC055709]
MAKFKFDKSAARRLVQKRTEELAQKLTRDLNALVPTHQGRPVDEVKEAIRSVWTRSTGGGSITDPELTQFAESIAGGQRVAVRAGRMK